MRLDADCSADVQAELARKIAQIHADIVFKRMEQLALSPRQRAELLRMIEASYADPSER